MPDRLLPDKPGLWWYDISGEYGSLGELREQVVEVYGVRGAPCRLWFKNPMRDDQEELVDHAAGTFLSPVVSRREADELQRHAAALEAQVEDLEIEIIDLCGALSDAAENYAAGIWCDSYEDIAEAMSDKRLRRR